MGSKSKEISLNVRLAVAIWGPLTRPARINLRQLIGETGLSVGRGDLQLLSHRWFVTHSGLLRLALRKQCAGISVQQVRDYCDPAACRWVFRATVYRRIGSKGFVGYGDADPSNVSPVVRGAEMRVAETRAVNRAIRKAYGIGLCSVEELGGLPPAPAPANVAQPAGASHPQSGSNNGQPRLKDKLALLIRQHNLDPSLVKAYAVDFCGTETLRGTSRELVESFIAHLEKEARENRDSLVCKLNSYSRRVEVHS